MRLLIIEDDAETVDLFNEVLEEHGIVPNVATDRDDALAKISSLDFDLIVCDLKIPSTAGALDSSVQHGVAALAEVRSSIPGVPVIAFSAHGTSPNLVPQLLELSGSADYLGLGSDELLLKFLNKGQFTECVDEIRRVAAELEKLAEIEITPGGLGLTVDQKRGLRLGARRRGARVIRAEHLGGGLSGATVLRIRLDGESGEIVGRYVAKLGAPGALVDERGRYQTLVSGVLDIGVAPGISDLILAGASRTATLMYELADNYDDSVFSLLSKGDQREIADNIRAKTAPWLAGAPTMDIEASGVREPLISDVAVEVAASEGVPIDAELLRRFDSIHVQARSCVQHADLHGLNVLVADAGRVAIIDWGEVRKAPASLDPVTLEMSLLFHPKSPFSDLPWPSLEQAAQWHDLDTYVEGCPLPLFVRACREWAEDPEVSAGFREIAVVVGSYALRQIKYEGANSERALAFFQGALRFLGSE